MGFESHPGALPTLFRRLLHWGPLVALVIIKFVFFTCMYLTSWWLPPYESLLGTVNYFMYLAAIGLIMYHFICAVGVGGGFVPIGWRPEKVADEALLQYCTICEGFKAPRSHHCRRCGRCVMKMDHHCPWINACVGHKNHKHFCYFLLFCVTGSIQSMVLLCIGLQKAYNARWYEEMEERLHFDLIVKGEAYPPAGHIPPPIIYLSFAAVVSIVLSIGLALGVMIALGSLLYIQMDIVLKNQTSIESWIQQKAEMRYEELRDDSWIYPYDLGKKKNLEQVFCEPISDGIFWPVVEGCNQYTLTFEQKLQKEDKRNRQQLYVVQRSYYGGFFPWCGHGFCACVKSPLNGEPRLKLTIGQRVFVTRWKKHWLYGQLDTKELMNDPPKGWFPRGCVILCVGAAKKFH